MNICVCGVLSDGSHAVWPSHVTWLCYMYILSDLHEVTALLGTWRIISFQLMKKTPTRSLLPAIIRQGTDLEQHSSMFLSHKKIWHIVDGEEFVGHGVLTIVGSCWDKLGWDVWGILLIRNMINIVKYICIEYMSNFRLKVAPFLLCTMQFCPLYALSKGCS